MTEFVFPYGSGEVKVALPDNLEIIVAAPKAPLIAAADEAAEIARCLAEPVGGSRLRDIANRTEGPVAVIVSDYSRFTPTAIILPQVLSELHSAGIQKEEIQIISAGGLHRPSTDEELKAMLGHDIFAGYSVYTHDPDDYERMTLVGETTRGTPVWINSLVASARLKVTIGMIEPHQLAGWSGGGKNFVPGVAGRETVIRNHALSYTDGVEIGKLDGNPIYEDILEAVSMLEPAYMVNVILNEKKKIVRGFSGPVPIAHRAAAKVGEGLLGVDVPDQPDIVIVSAGGSPRDKDFWQTEGKALVRVLPVVKPGGIIVLLSECKDGIGHPSFAEVLRNNSVEGIMAGFDLNSFSTMKNKTYRLAKVLSRAKVFFVTNCLGSEDFPKMPIRFFSSAQEAVERALEEASPSPRVLAIPRSGSVLLKPQKK